MDNLTQQALHTLLEYVQDEEKKHWEESGKPTKGHIFNSIVLLRHYLKNNKKEESFTVLRVHRDDLKSRKYPKPNKLTDVDMEQIARQMADGIMGSGVYWDAIDSLVYEAKKETNG